MAEERTKNPDEIFCPSCGQRVKRAAEICVRCGVRLPRIAFARPLGVETAYCYSCGQAVNPEAEICVHCGVRLTPPPALQGTKSKTTAILLAVFFGYFTWLYTYREDGRKFWLGLGLSLAGAFLIVATLGLIWLVGLGFWVWAIVDTARKSDEWYAAYNRPTGTAQATEVSLRPSIGPAELIALGSAAVVIVSGFLPWYSVEFGVFGGIDRNGWQSPGAIWSILAIVAAVASGVAVVVRLVATDPGMREGFGGVPWPVVHLGLAGAAAVFLVVKLSQESNYMAEGFYVGIVGVAGLGLGSIIMLTNRASQND